MPPLHESYLGLVAVWSQERCWRSLPCVNDGLEPFLLWGWTLVAQCFGHELVPTSLPLDSVPFFLGAVGIECLNNMGCVLSIVPLDQ